MSSNNSVPAKDNSYLQNKIIIKREKPTTYRLGGDLIFKRLLQKKHSLNVAKKPRLTVKADARPITRKSTEITPDKPGHNARDEAYFDGGDNRPQNSILLIASEKFMEKDPNVLAVARVSAQEYDDINRLIKKLTLNFRIKRTESQFLISHGIFSGANFNVKSNDHDLSLHVGNASEDAVDLLTRHRHVLEKRLLKHEINLSEMRFN